METGRAPLHTDRPAVYLDQWVWIKLARASQGRPAHPSHVNVLDVIRDASRDGVAFPLSATHYKETARIRDPQQRHDLADLMAPISQMRTLRGGRELVRHQVLTALHELVGRPTFRPSQPEALGLGADWAFRGVQSHLRVIGGDRAVVADVDGPWLRHANQYFEAEVLAGPWDEDVPGLRLNGYVSPRELEQRPRNRVDWEHLLAEQLTNHKFSRAELRVVLLARQLTHEHLDLLNEAMAEYRLQQADITGSISASRRTRQRLVGFVERVPSIRIAAEMKLELFRNTHRQWTWNMVRDIDFLSETVPYCRVVVADRDATTLLKRTVADTRHGTAVISELQDLPDLIQDLRREAQSLSADPTGWDALGPRSDFRTDTPAPLSRNVHPDASKGWTVRYTAPDGSDPWGRNGT